MQEMQVRDRMIREKVALIRKLECDRDHADALETEELRVINVSDCRCLNNPHIESGKAFGR
jgi:hypothetical protein